MRSVTKDRAVVLFVFVFIAGVLPAWAGAAGESPPNEAAVRRDLCAIIEAQWAHEAEQVLFASTFEELAPYLDGAANWQISLSELLRLIEMYNSDGCYACGGSGIEDGFKIGRPL